MIQDYYAITKPGIIYGNAITLVAGFVLASTGHIQYWLLVATLLGLSLVIASGCVFNNYIDKDIDALMERTKNRALVKGSISLPIALLYASILGILGFSILGWFTNLVTVLAALLGLFVYVVVYSLWLKRTSTHSTIIGSIGGAVPPVVGYLAVTGHLDMGATLLFLVLALWQMPHFFAIAIYRLHDYKAASIPVLPVKKGIRTTQIQMLVYTSLFLLTSLSLTVFGYTGYVYFFSMALLGLVWLFLCAQGFSLRDTDEKHLRLWARKVFVFSIIILLLFCVLLTLSSVVS